MSSIIFAKFARMCFVFINIIYVGAGYAQPPREGQAGAYGKAAGRVCAAPYRVLLFLQGFLFIVYMIYL